MYGGPAAPRQRRGRLLLPDRSTTRTTRCRPSPRTSARGHRSRASTAVAPRPDGHRGHGHHPVLRLRPGRGPRGPGGAGRALRRRRRALVGHLLQAPARGGPRPSSAGTACTPTRTPRTPRVTEQLGDGDGPDRGRHRLHEGGARPDRPVVAPPSGSSRSAPTASAAATPARPCAASSRSTPPTSWSPSSPALAAEGDRRRLDVVHDAIRRYEIDPEAADPITR